MVNDVIADLFTRIRNALGERHETVSIPHSNMKVRIVQILHEQGFILNYDVEGESLSKKSIKINLKYKQSGESVISMLKRVSRSSKRIYKCKSSIPKVLNGFGLSILSTSKGILSGKEARQKNVGGELLGIVW